jgi:protein phosphatase PTC6
VSQYVRQELHGLLESADKSHIPEMYQYIKELGGYFKRFNGGLLSPWVKPNPPSTDAGEMDLHARATLTFFEVGAFQSTVIFLSNVPDCYCRR